MARFESNYKDKKIRGKGYDSLLARSDVSLERFRISIEKKNTPNDTYGPLDTVEIDEDERQQFVSTLTKLRPAFEQYNTIEIQKEANNSYIHRTERKKKTKSILGFASIKPTEQVAIKPFIATIPSSERGDSLSQRINNILNSDNIDAGNLFITRHVNNYSLNSKNETNSGHRH